MPGDGHMMSVIYLRMEHVRSALEGARCIQCDDFSLRKLWSQLALFVSEDSQAVKPHGSSSTFAVAACRLPSWESQMELVEEHERVPLTSQRFLLRGLVARL